MDARATLFPIDWEEPFGLVMIESMACGTPVIATRRGAVPEVIEHGRTGVIVDNYRDMEDPAVLELADTLDPVVHPQGGRGALLAGADGRELRRRVRGDHPSDRVTLRSQYDREIFRLALPALGALAAEPLYLLVDTAIVGHLGRSQLAALGIAITILGGTFAIFNFLQYGTTAQVARAGGAGEEETARRLGAQAVWLSLAFGIAVSGLIAVLAPQLVSLMGGEGQAADYAVTYLRIAAIGFPAAFLALGAQGYLRGVADLRTPLVVLIAGNVANVVLELLFVYGFDWGIAGSAWGTAVAQLGMGAAFVVVVLRRLEPGEARVRLELARRVLSLGKWIFIRTTALMLSFVLAGAVATRFGDSAIAAHQVAFQLWVFLALVLDSVAIAGQIIVGRELGAGRREEAYGASERMIWLSVALGGAFAALMLVLAGVLPRAFTGDASVLDETALLWPIFALMQPLNGAVFALDGILIGASDGPFLAMSMVAAFVACAAVLLATLEADWGIRGVWAALARPHRRSSEPDDDALPARAGGSSPGGHRRREAAARLRDLRATETRTRESRSCVRPQSRR